MNNNISCQPEAVVALSTAFNNIKQAYTLNNNEIKIASLNIDTGLAPETRYKAILSDYNIDRRMPGIKIKLKCFKIQQVDIIAIQEARIYNENNVSIDAVTPILEFLKTNGYISAVVHYNNLSNNVFQFITALDANKFEVISSERIFLSKNGKDYPNIENLSIIEKQQQAAEIKSHYFEAQHERQIFPRSFFITKAKHLATKKEIFVVNTHLGVFPESHKAKSIDYIVKYLTTLHKKNPTSIIFLAGDFNSFPDQQGIKQIKMLDDAGFKELSKTVVDANGKKIIGNSSFIAFPYDYTSYNKDPLVKKTLSQKNNNSNENTENLALVRNKFIETFKTIAERAETIWQQEHNEHNSYALYPLGGQLDHIFVLANLNIIDVTETATLQLMDMQGNMIAANNKAIVEHIQNSLASHAPAFATDHQGLVSSVHLKLC